MKKRLLIITSDYFHPVGHRIHHILGPLMKEFNVKIITLDLTLCLQGIVNTFKFLFNTLLGNTHFINAKDENMLIIKALPLPGITLFLIYSTIQKLLKTYKFDICLVIGPYMGFGTLLSRSRIPIVYEDTDRFQYFAKNKLSKLFNKIMEKYSIKKATYVISVGYSLAKSAMQIREDCSVTCIPNGVDFQIFSAELNKHRQRENVMVYVGTIAKWSGLNLAISSIPYIKREIHDIKLIIVGDGELSDKLKKLAESLKLGDCVKFIGRKKYTEIPKIFSICKIGLAVYPETDLMRYAFTIKVIEYMAAGLPVVTTPAGDGAQIIRSSNAGFVITDYTELSLANAVIKLMKSEALWCSMSKNGVEYAKKFNWVNLANSEISVLNHIINQYKESI